MLRKTYGKSLSHKRVMQLISLTLTYGVCAFLIGCGGGGGGKKPSTSAPSISSANVTSAASSTLSKTSSQISVTSSKSSSSITSATGSSTPSSMVSNSIEISAAGAANAEVVMDAKGNAIAIWLQVNGSISGDSLWASRYGVAGQAWSTPVLLEADSGSVNEPHITIDPETGKAVVSWRQFTSATNDDIWVKPFDPSTGWGTETRIEESVGNVAGPRAAIDSNGNIVVVWSQDERKIGRYSVWANRFTALGNSWGQAVQIETNDAVGGADVNPRISMLSTGEALVVWSYDGGIAKPRGFWSNKCSNTGTWGTAAELIADTGNDQFLDHINIASDASGNALLVWAQVDFMTEAYRSTLMSTTHQGAWQTTRTPVAPTVDSAMLSNSTLAINAQGKAAVVWAREDYSIQASLLSNNGAWGMATPLKSASALDVKSLPSIAIDGNGNALATWSQTSADRLSQDVWLNRYSSTTNSWGTSQIAETYEGTASTPKVAASANGASVLVWTNWVDTKGTVIAARYFSPGN
jgi:hypothetical protein